MLLSLVAALYVTSIGFVNVLNGVPTRRTLTPTPPGRRKTRAVETPRQRARRRAAIAIERAAHPRRGSASTRARVPSVPLRGLLQHHLRGALPEPRGAQAAGEEAWPPRPPPARSVEAL